MRSNKNQALQGAAVFLGLALWAGTAGSLSAAATWPALLNYQGQLTDAAGTSAVADASYSVLFSIYGGPTGASPLWSETQTVTTRKGLFHMVLGSVNTLAVLTPTSLTNDLWLGLTVGTDAEMTPRQQLLPAVYALNAQMLNGLLPNNSANNLVVLDSSGKIPAGLVQTGSLAVPLDLSGTGAYTLNVSNTSAVASVTSLVVNANGGTGILAQSANGVGLSVTSQSTTAFSLFSGGNFPSKFVVGAGVTANAAVIASTQGGSNQAMLVDRGDAAAVWAKTTASGVFAVSGTASSATAIFGQTNSGSATDYGVYGANSASGTGVLGSGATGVAGSGSNVGVSGTSGSGTGVVGIGGAGVLGQANKSGGVGVSGGSSLGAGLGVYGAVTGSGGSVGVEGFSSATDGYGVVGILSNSLTVTYVAGVLGRANSALFNGIGVRGEGNQGVYGISTGQCGVCGYNSNAAATYPFAGVYANSAFDAILAESTSTTNAGYGIYATTATIADASAAGYFSANGGSGVTNGLYALNSSPAGYAVHAAGARNGFNYYSDPANSPAYGFFHEDFTPVGNAIGVHAIENCASCYAGDFRNTAAQANVQGAALNVQGRVKIQGSAGIFGPVAAGSSSFELDNNYITTGSLVFLTVLTPVSSVAAVTSVGPGAAIISFTPSLATAASYQFLVIGQ